MQMTELIRKHYNELKFLLRLRHSNGKYVGKNGFVESPHKASYYCSGPEGRTVDFLLRWEIEECDNSYLVGMDPSEFCIESELDEC